MPAETLSPLDQKRLETLRSAPLSSWIALSADETEIVAVGTSALEVSQKLEELGIEDVILMKTPPQWGSYAL